MYYGKADFSLLWTKAFYQCNCPRLFFWTGRLKEGWAVIRWTHTKTRFLPIGNDVWEIPTQSRRVFKWKEDSVTQCFIYQRWTDWESSDFPPRARLVSVRGQLSSCILTRRFFPIPLPVWCFNNKVLVVLAEQISDSGLSHLFCCSFLCYCVENCTAAELCRNKLLYCTGCTGTYYLITASRSLPSLCPLSKWHFCTALILTSAEAPEYFNSHQSFSLLNCLLQCIQTYILSMTITFCLVTLISLKAEVTVFFLDFLSPSPTLECKFYEGRDHGCLPHHHALLSSTQPNIIMSV